MWHFRWKLPSRSSRLGRCGLCSCRSSLVLADRSSCTSTRAVAGPARTPGGDLRATCMTVRFQACSASALVTPSGAPCHPRFVRTLSRRNCRLAQHPRAPWKRAEAANSSLQDGSHAETCCRLSHACGASRIHIFMDTPLTHLDTPHII